MAKAKWLGKLKQFMEALSERYQRVLQIVDDALASDDFKEKKWAVDLILKGQDEIAAERKAAKAAKGQPAKPVAQRPEWLDVSLLSDEELLRRIRDSLQAGRVPEPSETPQADESA